MSTQFVADQLDELRRQAANHKRLARKHKRLARESMQELREFCERNGIEFNVIRKDGEE